LAGASANDSAGNASDWSNPRAFTVEPPPNNRPPAVPELVAPADGATVSPTPTLRVRLSDPDNDQVQAVIEVSDASGVVRTLETGFVASGSEASVSVDPSLEAGDYTWRARARDSAGNESDWSTPSRFSVAANVPTRLEGIRTFALSLRTPVSDPNALGLNGVSIVRWDRRPSSTPKRLNCALARHTSSRRPPPSSRTSSASQSQARLRYRSSQAGT
jgi:hypothetical protein